MSLSESDCQTVRLSDCQTVRLLHLQASKPPSLQASEPPSLQASKPPVASAGCAKRKQSARPLVGEGVLDPALLTFGESKSLAGVRVARRGDRRILPKCSQNTDQLFPQKNAKTSKNTQRMAPKIIKKTQKKTNKILSKCRSSPKDSFLSCVVEIPLAFFLSEP